MNSAHGQPDALTPIDLRAVRVGGEIGDRIDATVHNNLLVIDVDRDFLKPFQERTARDGYVGLGKLIDSAVRFAAYTNEPAVLERKQHLVESIVAAQEADGYLGMMVPDARLWSLWDMHEMAYLIYGLTTDYQYFQNENALAAARKAADYIIRRWQAEPDRVPGGGDIKEYIACTGLESALLALFQATDDRRYLDFCVKERNLPRWDGPIVLGRWGQVEGHAYAYLARCVAQARLYRTRQEPQLLVPSHRATDFLLRQNGLTVTGGFGLQECWSDTQDGQANLGETCATAYFIRLLDELLRLEDKPVYGDAMERAIYNALFAAQSPDGRRIRYFSPFEGPRAYFDKDTYCCPCNYRRIIAELPGLIYYQARDGIVVNLYVSSSAQLQADGKRVRVTQTTDYPSSGKVRLTVDPDASGRFSLRLRIPAWCEGARVTVNGSAAPGPAAGGHYLAIDREWKAGDRVDLDMPMPLRLVRGRVAQAGRAAVMCGPRVFCLNRALNPGLKEGDLRLVTIDPSTLEGPYPDDTVRKGGLVCKVRAWRSTNWYPHAPSDWQLTLTEFPDPGGEAVYFNLPNPGDPATVDDVLTVPR